MADMSASTERPTIDEVFLEFLDDQQRRLSPRTWRRYADVVELLRACLNGYGYQSLPETDQARWEAAYDTGGEEAFCRLFGPEQIVENYGEFLGYFIVRKVLAGQELLRAAGTVTRRLAQWLAERGYLNPAQADLAAASAAEASRDLPHAEQLATLLHEHARGTRLDPTTLGARDYVEDCLEIERVQPGALWFADGIGPVAVPAKATRLAHPGWSVTVVLGAAETAGSSLTSATSTRNQLQPGLWPRQRRAGSTVSLTRVYETGVPSQFRSRRRAHRSV